MFLSDHQNLLSTFGKDSQSSNRKSKDYQYVIKSKRISLNYDKQPKSRYQQILSQRKTLTMLQKLQQPVNKTKNASKKLKTQSDIDCLNTRIRRSISGIAQTICKSKIKSNVPIKSIDYQSSVQQKKKLNHLSKDAIQSQKYLRTYESKKYKPLVNDKQNINITNLVTNFDQSKRNNQKNLSKQQYLKNSTKKKGRFFQQSNQCPIKSSFSIDINSQSQSLFQSSRKRMLQRNCSKFNLLNINPAKQSDRVVQKFTKDVFSRKAPNLNLSIGRQMQQTLKKQFKQLAQSNYTEQSKFLQTKGNKQNKSKQQFLFYQDLKNEQKSPDFNKIQFPKVININPVKRNIKLQQTQPLTKNHRLIETFMRQIQLDYDLRHAKHIFSGIQQPFYAHPNDQIRQCKWKRLNEELNNLGLFYSVQTIKKIFLPSQQQIDPFLSVGKPHEELLFSLIYAYQTAQIYWQQNIYQKWQHWDLRDIDLTIQNIDRDRKGYITVQDIAAFISMQTGRQYKNRDVVLIYKRLVNGFWSRRDDGKQVQLYDKTKGILKFRSLIDSLIKPF